MEQLVEISAFVNAAVFSALGVTCLVQWRRHGGEPRKWAAITFGILAAVGIVARIIPETGGQVVEWERKLDIATLIAFPYCLYRFGATFGSGSNRLQRAIACATALMVLLTMFLPDVPARDEPRAAWFQLYLAAFLVYWTTVSLLVAVLLWRGGRHEPTVIRRRVEFLALGSIGLSAALIVAGIAGQAGPGARLVVQLFALASALLFFAGFAPPRLLLVAWRSPEQVEIRRAVEGLVSATDYEDLRGLLSPVANVVGGSGAALVGPGGAILARSGVEDRAARTVAEELVHGRDNSTANERYVGLPLRRGWLVVWITAYTPFFGREQIDVLRSTASLFDVALERIRVARLEETSRRALQRQKEFSQSLIRSSTDGMLAFDRELRYTLWNPAMERMTGVPASEVLDRVAFEKFPFMEKTGLARAYEECLEGRQFTIPERYFDVPETGVRGWFEISYSPLHDESGDVVGGLSVARDVTARKEAEGLRSHLAAIVDSSDDAILSKDLEGTILSWNPAAERLYGYSAEEMVGHSVSVLAPPDRPDEIPGIFERIARGEPVKNYETERIRKDGTRVSVSLTVSPTRTPEGEVVGASTIARDTTEKIRAKEELRAAKEDAERANETKSEFLSRMSHELRTPLNAILGFAQLMDLEDLPSHQREYIEHVQNAGRHLLDLVNEILDISRIETGRLPITLELVPVREVVLETVKLAGPMAEGWNVEVKTTDLDACEFYVFADRQRLKQVLLNLLSNAIKYNRRGGTASVECRRVGEEKVRIAVSDSGRGIAPDKMDRLFEPFDRLGAEEFGIEGTGLGLALSKRLMDAMGGTLDGASVEGEGSTFWVEVPLVETPSRESPNGQRPDRSTTHDEGAEPSGVILLVEDNVANALLIQHVLTKRPGVRLLEAMQGTLGLDLAQRFRPDLILLDLDLPDIPGSEVLRRLREDPATSTIPVAIVSAEANKAQIADLLERGAQAYLTKPIEIAELLAIVDRALSGSPLRAADDASGPEATIPAVNRAVG